MAKYVMVVLTNPVAGKEEEFNDWYSNQHLSDVVALPGFVSAQRFVLEPHSNNSPGDPPYKYLALYDIETDDISTPFDALAAARGTPAMPVSDALDRPLSSLLYKAITPTPNGSGDPDQDGH